MLSRLLDERRIAQAKRDGNEVANELVLLARYTVWLEESSHA